MEKDDNNNRISEEEKERLREKMNQIREDLQEQLEEIEDEILDKTHELKEEREEIQEDLKEALEELRLEEEELRRESDEIEEGLKNLNNLRKEEIREFQRKVDKHREKVSRIVNKITNKAKRKMEKAEKKVAKRINISVTPEMSEDWKDWAKDLGTSVSELIRKSMKFVKENIGDIRKLENMSKYFEKMDIETGKGIHESRLGESNKSFKSNIKIELLSREMKEAIKKRIQGIIKLHRSIPIDKLALAMNRSVEEAEVLIYELAGEGLEGTLEGGIFKYSEDIDTVISKFFKKIDEM